MNRQFVSSGKAVERAFMSEVNRKGVCVFKKARRKQENVSNYGRVGKNSPTWKKTTPTAY